MLDPFDITPVPTWYQLCTGIKQGQNEASTKSARSSAAVRPVPGQYLKDSGFSAPQLCARNLLAKPRPACFSVLFILELITDTRPQVIDTNDTVLRVTTSQCPCVCIVTRRDDIVTVAAAAP